MNSFTTAILGLLIIGGLIVGAIYVLADALFGDDDDDDDFDGMAY